MAKNFQNMPLVFSVAQVDHLKKKIVLNLSKINWTRKTKFFKIKKL